MKVRKDSNVKIFPLRWPVFTKWTLIWSMYVLWYTWHKLYTNWVLDAGNKNIYIDAGCLWLLVESQTRIKAREVGCVNIKIVKDFKLFYISSLVMRKNVVLQAMSSTKLADLKKTKDKKGCLPKSLLCVGVIKIFFQEFRNILYIYFFGGDWLGEATTSTL